MKNFLKKIIDWVYFQIFGISNFSEMKYYQSKSYQKKKEKEARERLVADKDVKIADAQTHPKYDFLEFAFVSGGKRYYKAKSDLDLPVKRAYAARTTYSEMEYNMSREYLEAFVVAMKKSINKADFVDAGKLLYVFESRLEHISDFLLMFKLASVIYVEEHESPFDYNYEYNYQKIEEWLKSDDVHAFFLREPIKSFLPSFESIGVNFLNYLKMQSESLIHALEYHINTLSESPEESSSKTFLKQQLVLTKALQNLAP